MICHRITVENFRNIAGAEVAFAPGVNILSGANAQGKTSLLEAVCLISLGRSFRGAHETDMIRFGEDYTAVSLDYSDALRPQNISVYLSRDKRRQVEHNRGKITRMSDMIGAFRSVIFCPEHLSLIKDGPAERRAYLDVAISQLRPVYLRTLQRYNQILRQRNQLIKNAFHDRKTFDETVEFWSEQLATEAAVLSKFRLWYAELCDESVKKLFLRMTGEKELPEIRYSPGAKQAAEACADVEETKKRYMELLMGCHDREIAQGATLFGAHKDDLEILLNGRPARIYGSQGQQRSLAIAMKMAEGEIGYIDSGEYPVLLLDDVLSELDTRRRTFLQQEMNGRQVIMTTCEPISMGESHILRVSGGTFSY